MTFAVFKYNFPEYCPHWNQPGEVEPVAETVALLLPTRVAAPVTGAATTNASSAAEVRLTAREAQAAQDGTHVWNYDDPNKKFKKGDPIGIQEFARRKRELTKQGAYDRTYETQ